ncbi:MAG: hypothetical protein M3Q05_06590 [Bacteroidota bacterium]|nr:hypothetical protein [Bacteroidota bacterium]
MKSELKQTKNQQKETRNKILSGWNKWEGFDMEWTTHLEDEIIWALHPKPTSTILVAAGSTTWLKMKY